jgi:hypothetical protein
LKLPADAKVLEGDREDSALLEPYDIPGEPDVNFSAGITSLTLRDQTLAIMEIPPSSVLASVARSAHNIGAADGSVEDGTVTPLGHASAHIHLKLLAYR